MHWADLLRALRARGLRPAVFVGQWGGFQAVIAPTPTLQPGTLPEGQPWIGLLGYPDQTDDPRLIPEVVGGDPGPLWLCDAAGSWTSTDPSLPVPAACAGAAPVDGTVGLEPWQARWSAPDHRRHRAAVLACQEAIRAGDVYQVNVCTRFDGELSGDAADMFADIALSTAPTKAVYLEGDWGAIASFSPETFVTVREGVATERPIKGTLPRSADPETLRQSAKDVAENVMIVDLVRNDLSRVAEFGSVRTPELLRVEPAPGVWHLVSTVTARLRPDVRRRDILDATFPPASVTGTPKIAARQRITAWESHTRGSYCGAIGIDHPATGLDLNVAIRTVEVRDGTLRLGVGGGITIDSDPEAEWRECMDKARSIISHTHGPMSRDLPRTGDVSKETG